MFSSFKNTELFRYYIRVDLNKSINKILAQNNSNFSLIAGSIFSGSFSVLATIFSMDKDKYSSPLCILLFTAVFSFLFIIGMFIFHFGHKVAQHIMNSIKKENAPSNIEIKGYIDDYDHIACDNILISQNFIDSYKASTCSDLKAFYYFEIIYYSKNSIAIIKRLFMNKEACITDEHNTDRVHLFRIENSLNMLNTVKTFLQEEIAEITINKAMINSLKNEFKRYAESLESLSIECNELIEQRYGKVG